MWGYNLKKCFCLRDVDAKHRLTVSARLDLWLNAVTGDKVFDDDRLLGGGETVGAKYDSAVSPIERAVIHIPNRKR
jgi:hypothetical protein